MWRFVISKFVWLFFFRCDISHVSTFSKLLYFKNILILYSTPSYRDIFISLAYWKIISLTYFPLLICRGVWDLMKFHWGSHASYPMYQPMTITVARIWIYYQADVHATSNSNGRIRIDHIIIYSRYDNVTLSWLVLQYCTSGLRVTLSYRNIFMT